MVQGIKWPVNPIMFMSLLHIWACLARSLIVIFHTINSWYYLWSLFSCSSLCSTWQYYESYLSFNLSWNFQGRTCLILCSVIQVDSITRIRSYCQVVIGNLEKRQESVMVGSLCDLTFQQLQNKYSIHSTGLLFVNFSV